MGRQTDRGTPPLATPACGLQVPEDWTAKQVSLPVAKIIKQQGTRENNPKASAGNVLARVPLAASHSLMQAPHNASWRALRSS